MERASYKKIKKMKGLFLPFIVVLILLYQSEKEMKVVLMGQNAPRMRGFEWGNFPHRMIIKNPFELRDPKREGGFLSFLTNYGGFPNDSHEECPA